MAVTCYAQATGFSSYTGTESTANASYIYSFFRAKGWSNSAICGMLGCMTWESQLNPGINAINGDGGFGLVQWTPKSNYTTWARKMGYPCGNDFSNPEAYLRGQCERIQYELENGLQWIATKTYKLSFKEYAVNNNGLEWSVRAFLYCYERASALYAHESERIDFAKHWNDQAWSGTSTSSKSAAWSAAEWAVSIANDSTHGYDQSSRWGPNYDCSSLVISAYEQAGVPVKTKGATYTGNMRSVFLECGFKDVTSQIDLSTGSGLIKGDVLINTIHHTCMSIGDGKIVQASINEKGTATGGSTGDQTGKEIWTRNYYVFSSGWNYVLRYEGAAAWGAYGCGTGVSIVRATPVTKTSWESNTQETA